MPRMADTGEEATFELRDYLRVLRHRAGMIVVAVFVTVAASVVASVLRTPVYQGEARVLLTTDTGATLFNSQTGQPNDPSRHVVTEIEVVRGTAVAARVRKELGQAPDVSVSGVGETDMISIRARHTDAASAAAIANAYANAYIEVKREQVIDSLLAAVTEVQTRIDDLQSEIDAFNAQIDAAPPDQRAAVEAEVARQRDPLYSQQAAFGQTLEELQVRASLDTGGARLAARAAVPDTPVEPRPVRSGILALVLGLALGVGVAFLLEYLDDSMRTKEDLERATEPLPVIGIIPSSSSDAPGKITLREPSSGAAESYRSLRTAVQFMGVEQRVQVIQVTSSISAEGKSTTVSNLGVAFASSGLRVAIVDFDLRRPVQHEVFGFDNATGFTSVLLGRSELASALHGVTGTPGALAVLTSGPVPPNPAELLGTDRVANLIGELRAQFDVVLIDTPPVLPVTDALVVSRSVDALLLVATAGVTTGRQLHRALEILRQIDAPVIGTVLNRAGGTGGYGYGYGYAPYGAAAGTQENGGRARRRGRAGAKKS